MARLTFVYSGAAALLVLGASAACAGASAGAACEEQYDDVSLLQTTKVTRHEQVEKVATPWIGVLGLPGSFGSERRFEAMQATSGSDSPSYFPTLYDEWIQSGGARVVGIPFDAFDDNSTALDEMLGSLNGVFITGGPLNLCDKESSFYRTGSYVFEWVKRANDAGTYYPLHGHCMGLQFLSILAAEGNCSVLLRDAFDAEDVSLSLNFTEEGARSQFARGMDPNMLETFANQNSTINLHVDGVSPASFSGSAPLSAFFSLVSTSKDKKGKTFVSTMEAKNYPILGLQWHPQPDIVVWNPEMNIDHSYNATEANARNVNYFVDQARKNTPKIMNMNLLRQPNTTRFGDGLSYFTFNGYVSTENLLL